MKRVLQQLIITLTTAFACTSVWGADMPSPGAQELDRIRQEMLKKKTEIRKANRKERSVLTALEKIDREIQTRAGELLEQHQELQEAESALHQIEASSATIMRELETQKQAYGMRLRALYKMKRSGEAWAYGADGFGSLVKKSRYLTIIADRDRTIIEDYGNSLRLLSRQQGEVLEKKNELLERRHVVEVKKIEQESMRRQKAQLLASVRQKKSLYEQTYHELEEASTSLWALIKQDEGERRAAKGQEASAPGRRAVFSGSKGGFPWPLEGRVLTQFGMQRHPQFGTMVFRRGIEIEAREGQEVRAVEEGQVAYADWYRGYGKLLILDHGNGFYTLYGNLSALYPVKGNRIARGQTIGLAGETGSLKGSKLYFEIRRNGEAQDPLGWLAKR